MAYFQRNRRTFVNFILVFIVLSFIWYNFYESKPVKSSVYCKNKIAKIIWPDPKKRQKAISHLGDDGLMIEDNYFRIMGTINHMCHHLQTLGPEGEGGWNVCLDPQFSIEKPCLVYSFGIDDDFRFEEAIEKKLSCEVHAFDPSMSVSSHQYSSNGHFHNFGIDNVDGTAVGGKWKMFRLKTIMKMLGHQERHIDYLKMDVEFSEWFALRDIIDSGLLSRIRQLGIETHTPEVDIHTRPDDPCTWSNRDTMATLLDIIISLQNAGFKTYSIRPNYKTSYKSELSFKRRYCCHNLHFVNLKNEKNVWRPP